MTPRADGRTAAAEASTRISGPSSTAKTTKGLKQSAPDRPIFSPEAPYVDRAAARRAAERGGSDNLTAERGGSDDFTAPPPDASISTLKVASSGARGSAADGLLGCRSEMAQRLAEVVGVLPKAGEGESSQDGHASPAVIERFLPGRMLYTFHLESSSPPSTIMPARRASSKEAGGDAARDAHLPADLLCMMINALVPKMEGGRDGAASRVRGEVGEEEEEDDDDDIFPDAGEYVPSGEAVTGGGSDRGGALMGRPVVFDKTALPATSTVPESIRRLAEGGKLATTTDKVSMLATNSDKDNLPNDDDYAECYPGVYESVSALVDDEDDGAAGKGPPVLTKRQLAAKERQKLDRQVSKVTRLLETRKRDTGGPSSPAD